MRRAIVPAPVRPLARDAGFRQLFVGAALAVGLIAVGSAHAAEFKTVELSDKTTIRYALVLPDGYKKGQAYPFIFALPLGQQDQSMVEAGLRVYWEEEARKRGVIVASPVAPNGVLFFRGSEKHVPELLRKFQEEFAVADGEFHLLGISNGGVAAFRDALLYPELFQSMTVLPGFPPTDAGYGYLSRLRDMRIAMYVGELDDGFRPQTERAHGVFKSVGKEIHLEIIPGEGHFVQSLGGRNAARLFDQILN